MSGKKSDIADNLFSLIIDTIPNPILEVDTDKRIIAANISALKKWNDIEVGQTKCGTILYGKPVKKDQCLVDKCLKTKQSMTEVTKNLRGESLQVKTNYINDGSTERVVLHISDISESVNKDSDLKKSRERYRNIIEKSPGAILIHIDGVIAFVNRACIELLEAKDESDLIGKKALDIVDDNFRGIISERMKQAIDFEQRQPPIEIKIKTLKGNLIDIETEGVPVTYNQKKAVQVILFDISGRKKMEERLRTSEEKYRTLALNIPLGVFRTTPSGKILSANPAISEIFGYESSEEFIAADVKKLYSNPNDRTVLIQKLKKEGKIKDYEVLFKKKNGEKFWGSVNETAIMDESGRINFVDGIIVDVTEKKMIEKEVLKKEKLDSLGILAGGIAHDFNNILTAIIGNISLAKMDENINEKIFDRLERVENAIIRAKNLTRQLLTFSKGGEPIIKLINLEDIIINTVQLSESGLKVKINCDIAKNLWKVKADEGQIGQVLQNLLINAAQAMPSGGKIDIKAVNVSSGSRELPLKDSNNYIKIEITDHGIGIPSEHLNKIFDPFFTTKQKGSGLGLSSVYSIISNHNGFIDVDSVLGEKTTFSIYLVSEEISNRDSKLPDHSKHSKRKINIMIMDDEELILESVSELLRKKGYCVEACSSGEEAVKLMKKSAGKKERFDVVILDLIVPGNMGGKEALKELKKIDPGIKAIASSGYSTDKTMSNFKLYGFDAALEKPYRIAELENTIKKVF